MKRVSVQFMHHSWPSFVAPHAREDSAKHLTAGGSSGLTHRLHLLADFGIHSKEFADTTSEHASVPSYLISMTHTDPHKHSHLC